MDVDDRPIAARLRQLGDRLTIAPDHVAALLVLASCACAGLLVLWWTARPITSPQSAASSIAPSTPASAAPAPGGAAAGVPASDGSPGASDPPTPSLVVVHVSGAVVAAGVVELPAGSRVVDAVDAAGGFRRRARTGQLNLARVVHDGEQIRVPGPGDAVTGADVGAAGVGTVAAAPGVADGAAPGAPGVGAAGVGGVPGAPGSGAPGQTAPIDLNAASAAQLEMLPGVGPVLSSRIVAHRDAIGGFTSIDQLLEVTGIGEKTFAALRELVVV